jgi:hypothetical protein
MDESNDDLALTVAPSIHSDMEDASEMVLDAYFSLSPTDTPRLEPSFLPFESLSNVDYGQPSALGSHFFSVFDDDEEFALLNTSSRPLFDDLEVDNEFLDIPLLELEMDLNE